MIELDNNFRTGAKIRAIGIGGCGCNAIDNLIGTNLQGVDFIAANSDTQSLSNSKAGVKIQVGKKTARGLGVGGNPEIGKLKKHLSAAIWCLFLQVWAAVLVPEGLLKLLKSLKN